jgi:hypothetical protein
MSPLNVPPEYEKFFDSKRLQQNLMLGALYLATFEVLKSIVIDDPSGWPPVIWPRPGPSG